MRLIFSDVVSTKPGGAETLIAELARCAYFTRGVPSVLLGPADSFVAQRLRSTGTPHTHVPRERYLDFAGHEHDLYVHFSNTPWLALTKTAPGNAVIWGILSHLITDWNRFRFETKLTGRRIVGTHLTRTLIKRAAAKSSLVAMDGATAGAITKFVGVPLQIPIVPVPVNVANFHTPHKRSDCAPFTISYIGRSEDIWKIIPLRRLLADLGDISQAFAVRVYTDCGQRFAQKLGAAPRNVMVTYCEGQFGSALRERISSESCLHVSMGISALEGALARVPTLLIDPSFTALPPTYKYRWLFETTENSLGTFAQEEQAKLNGHDLSECISMLSSESTRDHVVDRCVHYVHKNHSPEAVLTKLLDIPTTAKNSDLSSWTPSSWDVASTFKNLFSA